MVALGDGTSTDPFRASTWFGDAQQSAQGDERVPALFDEGVADGVERDRSRETVPIDRQNPFAGARVGVGHGKPFRYGKE